MSGNTAEKVRAVILVKKSYTGKGNKSGIYNTGKSGNTGKKVILVKR